jgi:hypothetical protein
MMAWAFETVGVTPSNVKGSAAKSNAVLMRSFFFMSHTPYNCDLNLPSSSSWGCYLTTGPLFFDPAQIDYGNETRRPFALPPRTSSPSGLLENEPGGRPAAKLLTKNEARRIAPNVSEIA